MNPETFFDKFGLLADTPNGVQKLRELILQLAVQGKLVPQDPNDEPAAVLLGKIGVDKERLIKDKKLKKPKLLPPIELEERPFNIAKGWEFIRLGEIGYWAIGSGFPKSEQGLSNKPILFCKVSDMNLPGNEKWIKTSNNTIDDKIAKKIRANIHPSGTVIFPKIGGAIATNKRRILTKSTSIDNNCLGITPSGLCDSNWLYFLLSSIDLAEYQSGTSIPALNQGTIGMIVVGLPPSNEQKRIVAKVDQLMALCDELEARQQKKQETRLRLNSAALDKLLTAHEPAEFANQWQRVCDNFDLLYDNPETVGELRKAILQLAVQGRLVRQDANDEPAAMFIDKIKAEKKQLIKENKIKTNKPSAPIEPHELEYKLPDRWDFTRLSDICELITDGTHQTPKYTEHGRIFISAKNVKPFRFMTKLHRFVSEDDYQGYIKNRKPEYEDILLTRVGAKIGEAAIIDKKIDFAIYVSVALIRPFKKYIDPYYLTIWLNSPSGTKKSSENTYGKGVSQGNLNLGLIRNFIVSIPPFNEQRRIVAKVDQLMVLCDELESKLDQSQTDGAKLMEAVVAELVGA